MGYIFGYDECKPVSEPSQHRWILRSVQGMPQPSLLAKQTANRVIKYARCARSINDEDMCCLSCGFIPISPVTGKCGHTRCTECIKRMAVCPCGHEGPKALHVNIVVRDLLANTKVDRSFTRISKMVLPENKLLNRPARKSAPGPIRNKRTARPYALTSVSRTRQDHLPMTAEVRFSHALELIHVGKYKEAAPHLALVAASYYSEIVIARNLLAQVIMVLSGKRDPRCLTRELNHLVRRLSPFGWIKTDEMECILCAEIFTNPVTTPCGHMFCRICLEKTLDYRKRCPLCLRDLESFILEETNNTTFVVGALAAINAIITPKPMDEDLVPIFVCTVAFPAVSCPLFIFDPRYWLMIRRVLESKTRRFGMVAMDKDKRYSDYGTILEVRDCVHLEDGRSILSTIGLSRFRVIERGFRDGCEVARIRPIRDVPPPEGQPQRALRMFATQILIKGIVWLTHLGNSLLDDIEIAFGRMPIHEIEGRLPWWESNDGPSWLWWLLAVLPLRPEIKVLILSTDCLNKRLLAVSRTLEAVEHITIASVSPSQCDVQFVHSEAD